MNSTTEARSGLVKYVTAVRLGWKRAQLSSPGNAIRKTIRFARARAVSWGVLHRRALLGIGIVGILFLTWGLLQKRAGAGAVISRVPHFSGAPVRVGVAMEKPESAVRTEPLPQGETGSSSPEIPPSIVGNEGGVELALDDPEPAGPTARDRARDLLLSTSDVHLRREAMVQVLSSSDTGWEREIRSYLTADTPKPIRSMALELLESIASGTTEEAEREEATRLWMQAVAATSSN